MKVPKYWARSTQVVQQPDRQTLRLVIWQWSDVSRDEAQQKADTRIRELAHKVFAGAPLNRYAYGERPLREEITQGVTTEAGSEVGIVTRNLYGALVLNTAHAMFIDIDFADKDVPVSPAGTFQRMLGMRSPDPVDQQVQRITAWASRYPDLSIRIYRTFTGLRCLITNQTFDPGWADTTDILRAVGSDPLYIRLCQAQACFRARLTPKPWRCNMDTPSSRYPWENTDAEIRYREWERRYEQAITPYAVCRLVKQLGPQEIHPDVEPVLTLHDRLTCSEYERRLA